MSPTEWLKSQATAEHKRADDDENMYAPREASRHRALAVLLDDLLDDLIRTQCTLAEVGQAPCDTDLEVALHAATMGSVETLERVLRLVAPYVSVMTGQRQPRVEAQHG